MFSADRSIPPLPYFALHARDEETRVTLIPYVPNVVIRDVRDRRACIYTRDACTHGGQAVCTCTGSRTNFRDRLMDDTFVCLVAYARLIVGRWRFSDRSCAPETGVSAPERNWTVFDKYFPTKVPPFFSFQPFEIKISS